MFLTRPLGEFVRKSYLPSAVVILDEAHRMFLEESVEEGLLETPSFQGALFAELSRHVTDTNHMPHEHISFFENIRFKICHLLVPKVSLAVILAHIHGT